MQLYGNIRIRSTAGERTARWLAGVPGEAFRWIVAAVALTLALGARAAIGPHLPPGLISPTLFPVVLLTCLAAGPGPAIVTALAAWSVAWYSMVPPVGSFEIDASGAFALAVLAAVSATELLIAGSMKRALGSLAHAEITAQRLARQRDLVSAEIQHRVANNLSVLASLVAFERRRIHDPAARRALDDTVMRIGVVSEINRLLQSTGTQDIDYGHFLRVLAPKLLLSHGSERRIALDLAVESMNVPASKAVPMSLVAAELLSNAMEHGFPEGQVGHIKVTLERTGASSARLLVRDDGVGLPPDFRLSEVGSVGLTMVRGTAEDLEAEFVISRSRGTIACFAFRLNDACPRFPGPEL